MSAFVGGLCAPERRAFIVLSQSLTATAHARSWPVGRATLAPQSRDADTKCGLLAAGTEAVGSVRTHHQARELGVP